MLINFHITQLTLTCLNSTIETLEKGVKCSKLPIKALERCQWHGSGVFIAKFEHISCLFLRFLLSTLNMSVLAGYLN